MMSSSLTPAAVPAKKLATAAPTTLPPLAKPALLLSSKLALRYVSRPQDKLLLRLMRGYVSPKAQDVNQFFVPAEEPSRDADDPDKSGGQSKSKDVANSENNDQSASGSEAERSLQRKVLSMSVLHNQLIYPSAETSMKILKANRDVYERMQGILESIERRKYKFAVHSCKAAQRRLNYFNCRVRLSDAETTSEAASIVTAQHMLPMIAALPAKVSSSIACEANDVSSTDSHIFTHHRSGLLRLEGGGGPHLHPIAGRLAKVSGARQTAGDQGGRDTDTCRGESDSARSRGTAVPVRRTEQRPALGAAVLPGRRLRYFLREGER